MPIPVLPVERMVSFAVLEGPIMREFAVVLVTELPMEIEPEALATLLYPTAVEVLPLAVFDVPKAVVKILLAVLLFPNATLPIADEVLLFPNACPVRLTVFEKPNEVADPIAPLIMRTPPK